MFTEFPNYPEPIWDFNGVQCGKGCGVYLNYITIKDGYVFYYCNTCGTVYVISREKLDEYLDGLEKKGKRKGDG